MNSTLCVGDASAQRSLQPTVARAIIGRGLARRTGHSMRIVDQALLADSNVRQIGADHVVNPHQLGAEKIAALIAAACAEAADAHKPQAPTAEPAPAASAA